MNKKTISILVYNLSSNALVRTYPLAKTLSRYYNVEIIGVLFSDEIYNPYQDEFQFKIIRKNKTKNVVTAYFSLMLDIIRSIEGDIIYAFKPKLTSFGAGLIAKMYYRLPLILDIEDLETARWIEANFVSKIKLSLSRFDSENELLNVLIEKFIPLANDKIVVSRYLENKFGGSRIVHGADVAFFDPNNFSQQQAREKLGLKQEEKYILFSGMPREHKGIEDLLAAILNLNQKKLKLLLVGGDVQHSYYKKLLSIGKKSIIPVGPKSHSEMPSYLAASDIVVLPQRGSLFANAQVPAKVFEAMAMKKPIISTNISDLSEILDGCGIIIDPIKDTTELENKIKLLINDTSLSKSMGSSARKKCIAEYSWDKMGEKLYPIFDKHVQK